MRPTSVILGKFRIMTAKQSVRGGWSGVAMGVRRSQVPLVPFNDHKPAHKHHKSPFKHSKTILYLHLDE